MFVLRSLAFFALASLTFAAAPAASDPLSIRIAAVESGLAPPARLAGTVAAPWTIASRLAHYGVPGVSLAVIHDGQLAWARGYGVSSAGNAASISPSTAFPVAEIGEALVAATALTLVDAGRLKLDDTVLSAPPVPPGDEPITLRRLLSHTAGLAATAPARVEIPPGTRWRHSLVGFDLARDLIATAGSETFVALAQTLVLGPAGLSASSYAPATGFSTTPTDLAKFALALRAALAGQPSFLSLAAATAMITPPLPGSDFGLGLGVLGTGENLQLAHSGSGPGIRSTFVFYPHLGFGAVVVTNSDNGGPLIAEILRSVAREFAWPDYRTEEKIARPLSDSAVSAFSGRYERENTPVLVFRLGGHFYIRIGDRPRFEIFQQSDNEFFTLDSPDLWSFERSPLGIVTHIILRSSPPQLYRRLNLAPAPFRVAPTSAPLPETKPKPKITTDMLRP